MGEQGETSDRAMQPQAVSVEPFSLSQDKAFCL